MLGKCLDHRPAAIQPDINGDRLETQPLALLLEGLHFALILQMAYQLVGTSLVGVKQFSGEFGRRGIVTRRSLPSGLAEQRDGVKIQLGQGRDSVKGWTREKSARVPPDPNVGIPQVFPGTPEDSAPERGLGHTRAICEVEHGGGAVLIGEASVRSLTGIAVNSSASSGGNQP